MIERAPSNLKGTLADFKKSLLERVHLGGRNPTYKLARQAWGDKARRREIIEMGQKALDEDSATSIDEFMQLAKGEDVLFRIGLIGALRKKQQNLTPGQDATRIFEKQRVQQLFNAVIPRSKSGGAKFADRAVRFGNYLDQKRREVATRQIATGGSPTARNLNDDAEMAAQTMSTIWNRFRSAPGLTNMLLEAVGFGLQRFFSYRQDLATAIARRLVEMNPDQQRQLLIRLGQRYGPAQLAQFNQHMNEFAGRLVAGTTGAVGEVAGEAASGR